MRVGVVANRQPPTVGGGFSFHETILGALAEARTRHQFVLLDMVAAEHSSVRGVPLFSVHRLSGVPANSVPEASILDAAALETAARYLGLDVVWYLDHMADVLSVPVFATVLDLAHRQYPFFPEVSLPEWGWGWEARESHYRRVLPRAARIFTGTSFGKSQVIDHYGIDARAVVVNPLPVPLLESTDNVASDREVLIKYGLSPGFLFYPAQLWPHKNHVNLLLALQKLERKYGLVPDLVLTGADKGNLGHVLQVADELGLLRRVRHLGFVPSGAIAALYRQAAALVFPSFFGPDNLPPLEAFHYGCPVLASRLEGAEEELASAAALFDPRRPEEIAAVTARILRKRRHRKALIRRGRKIAATRTPAAYVQVVLQALDEFESYRRNWPAEHVQPPTELSHFPDDVENAGLLQAGVYGDGWLAQHASMMLGVPPNACVLRIRGQLLQFGDVTPPISLGIRVSGQPLSLTQLDPGGFQVDVQVRELPNPCKIELAFSNSQQLPAPDRRTVGARLEFIGFIDQASARSATE